LAENVEIDSRSRWREAQALLQSDARYKNVEDAREREELFNVSSCCCLCVCMYILCVCFVRMFARTLTMTSITYQDLL
jgi:hypothetical protein